MKKFISVIIAIFITLALVPARAYAISDLMVSVNPSLRNSLAEYDISFVTGADLIGGKDDIIIQFPERTKLPCSCPHNWHLEFFEINGNKPSRAGKVLDIPNSMYLCIPGGITIKKGTKVNIVIKSQANIWNPSKPGKYQLTLWTTKEGKVKSNFYEITSTKLKDVSVEVLPETAGLIASYEIHFTTGEKGELSNGQHIYLEFPEGTVFPKNSDKTAVTVNGEIPEEVSVSGNILTIKISHSINKERKCFIKIEGSFGIKNPNEGGKKELFIWTDNEPEKVGASFEIKAQYTVSTFISTVPKVPDGVNGYFRTTPVVTLTGETNTGKTVSIFYKIDGGKYVSYLSPFSMPEGIHTLYYYGVAGNIKENPHSVVFKVDTIPPKIYIDFPDKNPFYTGDKTIPISGKVSEKGELIVGNKAVLLKKDLSFSTEVTLKPGKNFINISFSDVAGNSVSKKIEIIFDTTVPELTVTSPKDWAEITATEITVWGSVSPANSEVYVNGAEVAVSQDGSFSYSFVPNNKMNLVAIKLKAVYPYSGKSITKVITVVYKPDHSRLVLKIGSKSVSVNGKKKQMDVAPFIDVHSNRTLVPIRFVVELFGGGVSWDGKTRTVTIVANGKTVKLTIGSDVAYVNEKPFALDQPPIILHNRTFVPLRFIAEALGFKVVWNAKDRTITVSH